MLQMLIVDDELEEREGILFLLQKYQFDISTTQAPNGKIALEYLQEHPVDILFTDVRMPFMDGLPKRPSPYSQKSASFSSADSVNLNTPKRLCR